MSEDSKKLLPTFLKGTLLAPKDSVFAQQTKKEIVNLISYRLHNIEDKKNCNNLKRIFRI
jgi:hypothetical protein